MSALLPFLALQLLMEDQGVVDPTISPLLQEMIDAAAPPNQWPRVSSGPGSICLSPLRRRCLDCIEPPIKGPGPRRKKGWGASKR